MSLNLLAVQDEITAKLKEIPQDVYESAAPDDSKLRFDTDGTILPYVVVEFSDMYESNVPGGIMSSKYDVSEAYLVVSCIAPTQRSARQVADVVRGKLAGFTPADSGELRIAGGSRYFTTQDARPNRYAAEVAFTHSVNTVW